jgi:hypothetical protein
MVHSDDGRCLRVESLGKLEVTEDDADVRLGATGIAAVIEEERDGTTRRLTLQRADDGVVRHFTVNGREQGASAADAWLHALVPELVRQLGLGAEARVARIRRQQGVRGVLDEVARIESDGVKRVYLTTLVQGGGLTPEDRRGVARAVRAMDSDGDQRVVLQALLADGGALPAADLVATVRTIDSDGDKRVVLTRALEGARDEATVAGVLEAAADIDSDGDRRVVLTSALERGTLRAEAVRSAFFRAADGIDSDGDRRVVLTAALGDAAAGVPTVLAVVRSARSLDSDGEKALVLTTAAHHAAARNDAVRNAIADAARTLGSEGEYGRVMRALGQ